MPHFRVKKGDKKSFLQNPVLNSGPHPLNNKSYVFFAFWAVQTKSVYLLRTLNLHPPTATPILGQSPKRNRVLRQFLNSPKSSGPQSIMKWPDIFFVVVVVTLPYLQRHSFQNSLLFRGCSHIMSANFGGFQNPPTPLVILRHLLAYPPSPLRHASSAFARPPFSNTIL